jgi:toxin ParE1/3/4
VAADGGVTVRFLPSFVSDLEEAHSFLRDRSPRAAALLVERTDHLLGLLAEFPAMGRERPDLGQGLRSMRVRGFPYLVFYRVAGPDVLAIRVVHGARRIGPRLFRV